MRKRALSIKQNSCVHDHDVIGFPLQQFQPPPVVFDYQADDARVIYNDNSAFIEANVLAEEIPYGLNSFKIETEDQAMMPSFENTERSCAWGKPTTQYFDTIPSPSNQLVLFPDDPIQCYGQIERWEFATSFRPDRGYHAQSVNLAIFRRIDDFRYQIVGSNVFLLQSPSEYYSFVVPSEKRFDVEPGDLVGVFYKRKQDGGVVQLLEPDMYDGEEEEFYGTIEIPVYEEDLLENRVVTVLDESLRRAKATIPLLRVIIGQQGSRFFVDISRFNLVFSFLFQATAQNELWPTPRSWGSTHKLPMPLTPKAVGPTVAGNHLAFL